MIKGIINDTEKDITKIMILGDGEEIITGISGVDFVSNGANLSDYTITGDFNQSGEPGLANPVYPTGCGDLVQSGNHAGEYEISITCSGVTDYFYLQEPLYKVESYADVAGLSIGGVHRKIKKVVLTGQEDWRHGDNPYSYYINTNYTDAKASEKIICSHIVSQSNNYVSGVDNCFISATKRLNVSLVSMEDNLNTFVDFLISQYSNNTPVTIWYILGAEITETITMPTFQTASGLNKLFISTVQPPSSVSVTFTGIRNVYKDGWEVRDSQDRLIWYRNNTFTGTSSVSYKGYGVDLVDYSIGGNLVQSSSPTPQNLVEPDECGNSVTNLAKNVRITNATGQYGTAIFFDCDLQANTVYTLSFTCRSGIGFYTNENLFTQTKYITTVSGTTTVTIQTKPSISRSDGQQYNSGRWIILKNTDSINPAPNISDVMFNLGSTALPYEPSDYKKIPYSLNNVAQTPIYVQEPIRKLDGQNDILSYSQGGVSRKIKKFALTGDESWYVYEASNVLQFYTSGLDLGAISGSSALSNIAPYGATSATRASFSYGCYVVSNGYDIAFQMYGSAASFADVNAWKTCLRQQYADGNPVYFWYLLQTPEFESVTLPVISAPSGSDTLTITTTLSPSSVSVTGHVKSVV